jgi:hypothetical protein
LGSFFVVSFFSTWPFSCILSAKSVELSPFFSFFSA